MNSIEEVLPSALDNRDPVRASRCVTERLDQTLSAGPGAFVKSLHVWSRPLLALVSSTGFSE